MDITFRLAGPWGAGKGSNLQPSEVDNNFWSIAQAIIELQNDPSQPNGIASISVSGTQMTITLTDGSVMGPFTLPVLTFRWRGEWQPETAYAELDVVTVTDVGIFMVLVDHTSDTTFDAAFMVGDLAAYLQLFGSTDASLSALPDVDIVEPLEADDVLTWDGTDWTNTPLGTIAYQDADDVLITGGSITGMPAPVDPGDVVNKAYVDALPGGATAASFTMMSNITDGVAPAIPNTLTDFLDTVLGLPARGTLLYRGGPGWVALLPGAEGRFLQTHDAGADPTWAPGGSGVTSLTAGAGIDTQPDTIVATGIIALAPIADKNLLANTSGAAAPPVATTLTGLLDAILTNARGTLLTRMAAGWVGLAPGTNGYYLRTNGAGADATWDAPAGSGTVTSVATGTGLTGGPIIATGTVALAAVADKNLLANISGVSAAPTAATVSQLLDSAITTTQGAVLYRGASAWAALTPGTSGQLLTTGGAAANPSWANAPASPAIATARILANISGSTAVPIANTLTNILDSILGSSRGMVIYRGSGGWAALSPGTSGQVLTTGGAAGDPHWAAGGSGGASITVSDTPPASPSVGNAWWDGVSGQLFIWVNDGTSSQWVPASNQPGPAGPAGSANMSGMVAGQIPIAATATSVTSSVPTSTFLTPATAAATYAPLASPTFTTNIKLAGNYIYLANATGTVGGAGGSFVYGDASSIIAHCGGTGASGFGVQDSGGTTQSSLNVDGSIQCRKGYTTQPGSFGGYSGHVFNIDWTGVPVLWIDGVSIGQIAITCDYRIKENVAALPSTWDQVKALRPVSYTTADNEELLSRASPAERWGFIAHELQEALLPSAASGYKDAPHAIQSPDLMALLAALAATLQEAMARIEALEAA